MTGGSSSAEPAAEPAGRRDRVEFVRFRLDGDAYLLELGRVAGVVEAVEPTRVPGTGPAVAGVATVGSEQTVVLDGRPLLGLADRPAGAEPVLVRLDRGDARPTGLLVDGVVGVDTHPVERVVPASTEDWEPPADRWWFRAAVESADPADEPTGVLDLDAVVDGARAEP